MLHTWQAVQFLKDCNVDGALIVTTPQEVSIIDVRKEINFCKKASGLLPWPGWRLHAKASPPY